jgi:hypothetical protein
MNVNLNVDDKFYAVVKYIKKRNQFNLTLKEVVLNAVIDNNEIEASITRKFPRISSYSVNETFHSIARVLYGEMGEVNKTTLSTSVQIDNSSYSSCNSTSVITLRNKDTTYIVEILITTDTIADACIKADIVANAIVNKCYGFPSKYDPEMTHCK